MRPLRTHVPRGTPVDLPRAARSRQRNRVLSGLLLALIGVELCLLVAPPARYPQYFSMPGASGRLAGPIAALALYALAIWRLPALAGRSPRVASLIGVGAVVGVLGGAAEIASTAFETLWPAPQRVVTATTIAAMLGLFLLFAVSGYAGARRTRSFALGVGTAIWSAAVAILLVVAFGFALMTTSLPQLARNEASDPDYARSGWSDLRAFAIANTYDNGLTHLIEGPIIATMLGALGSGVGLVRPRGRGAGAHYQDDAPQGV